MDVWKGIKSIYNTNFKSKRIKKIRLGICAMDKKTKSKPMREILSRLPEELFEVIIFGDETILTTPPESWPIVDVLIAFYSSRYPTEKALQYVSLRKPFMINDLEMDATLKDRRKVYELLQANGIDVPVHVYCNREDQSAVNVVEEFDEYIVVNGVHINKPLVEKPVDAEDHNIYIYYPMSAGGGSKRLFRKVDDRSSEFYPRMHELRKEGSFIYEEFVVTQGTDVKVYTVGTDYGHAEARKSPVVDGRVNRDQAGLEVRYPVILSPIEKDMARKIVLAFKQTVCGFDILRVHGRSFCCDVNGFSFVKNSRKYYDDASQVLIEMMINRCRPELLAHPSTHKKLPGVKTVPVNLTKQTLAIMTPKPSRSPTPPAHVGLTRSEVGTDAVVQNGNDASEYRPPSPSLMSVSRRGSQDNFNDRASADEETEELRCVIAVIRHGDRTPKQKMKVKVSEPKFLDYFHAFAKTPRKDLKVKSRSALVRFLDVTREIIADGTVSPDQDPDLFRKLRQIRDVLERWEISGINRKLQMKPQKWADGWNESEEEEARQAREKAHKEKQDLSATDAAAQVALNADMQSLSLDKPSSQNNSNTALAEQQTVPPAQYGLATEVLLILKWGGDLTPLGREQAELLGARFRHQMYPDNAGGGVLRLHATYRHDLKIKASDEGRVMKTAAAFTKGLLELEGQLTPILASLVTIEEKNRQMLDRGGNLQIKEDMDRCKAHLNLLQADRAMDQDLVDEVAQGCPKAVRAALMSLGNPLHTLHRLHSLIGGLCLQLQRICELRCDSYIGKPKQSPSSTEKSSPGQTEAVSSIGPFPHSQVGDHDSHSAPENPGSPGTPMNPKEYIVENKLYLSETFSLMLDRWEKLFKDIYSPKTKLFDLTKVPDVYDMIRYDVLHNSHLDLEGMEELYRLAVALENSVVPQEYGKDGHEKRIIGSKVCGALLEKIRYDLTMAREAQHDVGYLLDRSHAEDLEINSLSRAVRTRLYFTSESHLHTLLNAFRYPADGGVCAIDSEGLAKLEEVSELSYLTQIVFRLFEDREDPTICRCEISFSPGATNNPFTDKSSALAPYITLSKSLNQQEMVQCITDAILASTQESAANSPKVHNGAVVETESACNDTIDSDVFNPDIRPDFDSKALDDSPVKPPAPLLKHRSDNFAMLMRKPIPLRRTTSVTVVSDNLPSDDLWEASWTPKR